MADLSTVSTERESALIDQLRAEVAAARQADELSRYRRRRVDELLVAVRQEYGDEMKLPVLEDLIGRFYDRATISRKTAAAIGATRNLAATA